MAVSPKRMLFCLVIAGSYVETSLKLALGLVSGVNHIMERIVVFGSGQRDGRQTGKGQARATTRVAPTMSPPRRSWMPAVAGKTKRDAYTGMAGQGGSRTAPTGAPAPPDCFAALAMTLRLRSG